MLPIDKIPGVLSHELLASIMPFYCCWLPVADDESKPCASSVAIASMLYSTRLVGFAAREEPWVN